MQPGGDPQWYLIMNAIVGVLTAVGTVGALWVAVLVARHERRERRAAEERANAVADREAARLRDQAVREERAQAERVTVEVRARNSALYDVHNASDLPLRAVRLWVYIRDLASQMARTAGHAKDLSKSERINMVPPGATRVFSTGVWVDRTVTTACAVMFVDAGERRWARTGAGRLHRLDDDENVAVEMMREHLIAEFAELEAERQARRQETVRRAHEVHQAAVARGDASDDFDGSQVPEEP